MTREAIDDAFALIWLWVVQQIQCYILAIANEAGVDYDLERINEIAKNTLLIKNCA